MGSTSSHTEEVFPIVLRRRVGGQMCSVEGIRRFVDVLFIRLPT